jgi:hypothetical protein
MAWARLRYRMKWPYVQHRTGLRRRLRGASLAWLPLDWTRGRSTSQLHVAAQVPVAQPQATRLRPRPGRPRPTEATEPPLSVHSQHLVHSPAVHPGAVAPAVGLLQLLHLQRLQVSDDAPSLSETLSVTVCLGVHRHGARASWCVCLCLFPAFP